MKIYRYIFDQATGTTTKTEMYDVEVDAQTELRQSISGEDIISSRFVVEGDKMDIQIGDFVEFKDSVYTILDEPQVKKSQNTFSYNLEFKSDLYLLKNVQMINPDTEEHEFYLFGNAQDMVSMVIANMNRAYPSGAYFADYVEQTEGKNLSFNNENCLAAIQKIATEFGCEFQVKGKQITFREKIGTETGLTFTYGKELREIERRPLQNAELVTVLYARGGERNITNEYGSKRLKIPNLENNKDVFGTIERVVTFDDIYPRFNGLVSSVSSKEKFTSTAIDFDLNDHLIGGEAAKVVFNSGDLSGREFEIRYNHSNKEITLIPYTDDTDLTLPGDILKPRVGDKFVFTGIKMPQTYIDNAEAELLERATEYLAKFSQPNVVYNVSPHYPELRRLDQHLNLGDISTIDDEDFGISFQTRILSLRQKIYNPFEYSIELGNQITVNYISKVLSDNKKIRNEIYLQDKYHTERLNRIYNSVKQFSQAVYINRGPFSPDNYYYNNKNRRDYVSKLKADGTKEWYYFIGEDHTKAEWIEANWELIGENFEIIATETILAENANIGNWLIQNGQIVSQAEHNGSPRVHLNGNDGSIRMESSTDVYSDDTTREYNQVLEIDSATGKVSVRRSGDAYQSSSVSEVSSDGIFSNFAGIDAISATTGRKAKGAVVGLGFGKLAKKWGNDFIAGVIGRAYNSSNDPAPAFGGAFWGLKSFGRYKGVKRISSSSTAYTIGEFDEYITCYNTGHLNITLPTNPHEGRVIEVKRLSGSVRVLAGNKPMWREQEITQQDIRRGDACRVIFDGNYWIVNLLLYY